MKRLCSLVYDSCTPQVTWSYARYMIALFIEPREKDCIYFFRLHSFVRVRWREEGQHSLTHVTLVLVRVSTGKQNRLKQRAYMEGWSCRRRDAHMGELHLMTGFVVSRQRYSKPIVRVHEKGASPAYLFCKTSHVIHESNSQFKQQTLEVVPQCMHLLFVKLPSTFPVLFFMHTCCIIIFL